MRYAPSEQWNMRSRMESYMATEHDRAWGDGDERETECVVCDLGMLKEDGVQCPRCEEEWYCERCAEKALTDGLCEDHREESDE